MRSHISLLLPALLALITFTSAASDFQNAVKCGRRFPKIQNAFEFFCNNPPTGEMKTNRGEMMVPSGWAQEGIGYTGARGNRFRIAVESSCSPAQYLPYKYCMSQFNAMCANTSNKWGYHTQHFGASGCQKFIIGPRSSPGKLSLPSTYCPVMNPKQCETWRKKQSRLLSR